MGEIAISLEFALKISFEILSEVGLKSCDQTRRLWIFLFCLSSSPDVMFMPK